MKKSLSVLLLFPLLALSQKKFDTVREKAKSEAKYEYVYAFENGYAVFRTFDSKMGLIDSTGKEIIKPVFNFIHNNKKLKNLLEVGNKTDKGFKRGFINLQGKTRVPIIYKDVYYLGQGLISVTNQKKGIIDTANNVILPLKFEGISLDSTILIATDKGVEQLYDLKGNTISDLKFAYVSHFKKDQAIVATLDKSSFIIDRSGNQVVEPIKNYSFEAILNNDLYLIGNNKTSKKGIINRKGEFQIECKYDAIKQSGSHFIVELDSKKGIVSANDLILKPIFYDELFYHTSDEPVSVGDKNLASNYIAKKENLYGVINPFLEHDVIAFQYKHISTFFNTYFITTNTDNKNGLFLQDGTKILDEEYLFYNQFKNKLFATKDNRPYIITFEKTQFQKLALDVDELVKHDDIPFYLDCRYQIFKTQDKFGVIDSEGIVCIPSEYQKIENIYQTNQFVVMKHDKFGVVNTKNEILLGIEYDSFKKIKEHIVFNKGKQKRSYEIQFGALIIDEADAK